MRFEPYRPALLPPLVAFWNRAFAARRNFFPVTEEIFRARVTEKRTGLEAFDPEGFVVALQGDRPAGFIHVGVRPEALCRTLDPEWPGGTQGYVAFLWVDLARRGRGVGAELWHRGLARLAGTRQVVIDGQCVNPFYGNSEGPFAPFWGTPEGPAVEQTDGTTQRFLARKGYAPRFRGLQLALDLAEARVPARQEALAEAGGLGYEAAVLHGEYPEVGRPAGERRRVDPSRDYECAVVRRKGRTAGMVCVYPLREARPGLWGVYEAKVADEDRGKGLGRILLALAIDRLRDREAAALEALTLPELSTAARQLYLEVGFKPATEWAIY